MSASVRGLAPAWSMPAPGYLPPFPYVTESFSLVVDPPVPQVASPLCALATGVLPERDTLVEDVGGLITELAREGYGVKKQSLTVRHDPARDAVMTPAERDRFQNFINSHQAWREKIMHTLYANEGNRPRVWFYPAAGYDLATAVLMQDPGALKRQSSVFILVNTNAPFVAVDANGQMPASLSYGRENLYNRAGPAAGWADSVIHGPTVSILADKAQGVAPLMLGRLKLYFDDLRVHHVVAFQEKGEITNTHGLIIFDLGAGTALQYAVYLHGTLRERTAGPGRTDPQQDMLTFKTGRDFPLNLDLFGKIDAIFVRGSQGCFSPNVNHVSHAPNLSRDYLLSILAANGGLLLEGVHSAPGTRGGEYEPEFEATPDATDSFSSHRTTSLREQDYSVQGVIYNMHLIEDELKWSYITPGTRASRLFRKPAPRQQ